jgi:CheY-like chemotaxis protein
MLLNLAINARDAMPSGGRLTIATANVDTVPAHLATELTPGQYVAISVSDTGTGMSPQVLARAFEPFFTTKELGKGTGLGLAQLYGFARQSGGTARIDSREGEGTTVTIYLPRTHQQIAAAPAELTEIRPAPATRVLVVDDDDDVRSVAHAIVEELGYQVVAAASGQEALQRLAEEPFTLLLTDVAMPGMSGVELARRVREAYPDLLIVFASGYADVQTFGAELSEQRLLKKPYRMTEVAAHLAAALGERRGGNVVELRRG